MNKKQNIPAPDSQAEKIAMELESLRQKPEGLNVPGNYFDSLSSRITDQITQKENRSMYKKSVFVLRKPVVWAPVLAAASIAVLVMLLIPDTTTPPVQVVDEWTEINSVYDASYAAEVLFAESYHLDAEIAETDINNLASQAIADEHEPTDEEITAYLNEQNIDLTLLTDY